VLESQIHCRADFRLAKVRPGQSGNQ
jgi:hypothetical protein